MVVIGPKLHYYSFELYEAIFANAFAAISGRIFFFHEANMASKTEKALLAAIAQMQSQIAKMQEPANNPAQKYLTDEALAGADWLKKGDYSALPKGMFFDFKMPSEQLDQYKKFSNVNQGGTFALGDNGGQGQRMNIEKQYLSDKFARDASQNYQDNIRGAAQNIRGGLTAAAGAKSQNDTAIMQALQGLTGSLSSMPKQQPWWTSLFGPAAQIASSFI